MNELLKRCVLAPGVKELPEGWGQLFLEPIWLALNAAPASSRGEFFYLSWDKTHCTMLRGFAESQSLAVWQLHAETYRWARDPFFWMANYPLEEKIGLHATEFQKNLMPDTAKVAKLREVFKSGDGAFLMGGAQAIVDGAKIRLKRPQAELSPIQTLWPFLPYSARGFSICTFWPHTEMVTMPQFVIAPEYATATVPGYLTEDQCREYPESPFEQQLQYSLDYADQDLFDKLMLRRSSSDTLRLGCYLVIFVLVLLVVSKLLPLIIK
jgi:hypothetical protein